MIDHPHFRAIDVLLFSIVAISIAMNAITYLEITDLRRTVVRIQLDGK